MSEIVYFHGSHPLQFRPTGPIIRAGSRYLLTDTRVIYYWHITKPLNRLPVWGVCYFQSSDYLPLRALPDRLCCACAELCISRLRRVVALARFALTRCCVCCRSVLFSTMYIVYDYMVSSAVCVCWSLLAKVGKSWQKFEFSAKFSKNEIHSESIFAICTHPDKQFPVFTFWHFFPIDYIITFVTSLFRPPGLKCIHVQSP